MYSHLYSDHYWMLRIIFLDAFIENKQLLHLFIYSIFNIVHRLEMHVWVLIDSSLFDMYLMPEQHSNRPNENKTKTKHNEYL